MDYASATIAVAKVLPWITIAGLLYRGYRKAKTSVTEWADTLLDNHATHMQASLARIEAQGDAQIDLLTRIAEK
jgi:uncharacterized membrane protein YgcG